MGGVEGSRGGGIFKNNAIIIQQNERTNISAKEKGQEIKDRKYVT